MLSTENGQISRRATMPQSRQNTHLGAFRKTNRNKITTAENSEPIKVIGGKKLSLTAKPKQIITLKVVK